MKPIFPSPYIIPPPGPKGYSISQLKEILHTVKRQNAINSQVDMAFREHICQKMEDNKILYDATLKYFKECVGKVKAKRRKESHTLLYRILIGLQEILAGTAPSIAKRASWISLKIGESIYDGAARMFSGVP